jgi:hypothetical protein
MTTDAP